MTGLCMADIESRCLTEIRLRDSGRPISFRVLAALIDEDERLVRRAVERLIRVHGQPICSSYDPKRPGYFWPRDRDELMDSYYRLMRHGVNIIRRARSLYAASEDEIMGQIRMILNEK
jgi:hypothetical protein